MNKKYELLNDETINFNGSKLYRIRALRDFGDVHRGDLGGYIETYDNLAQTGNCWVYDESVVKDDAKVSCNVNVHGKSIICGSATVDCYADIIDSTVSDNATVTGFAKIYNGAKIKECAMVGNYGMIDGRSIISGNACISGVAKITGESLIQGNVIVNGNAEIIDAIVVGEVVISDNAYITSTDDYFSINSFINHDVSQYLISFYTTENKSIMVFFRQEVFTLYDFAKYIKTLDNYEKDRDIFAKTIAFVRARFRK